MTLRSISGDVSTEIVAMLPHNPKIETEKSKIPSRKSSSVTIIGSAPNYKKSEKKHQITILIEPREK